MSIDSNLNEFLILLSRGLSIRRLYFAQHQKVQDASAKIARSLQSYFHETDDEELFVGVVQGNLIYKGKKLTGPSVAGYHIIELASKLCCGGFTFKRTASSEEIVQLLNLAAEIRNPVTSLEEAYLLMTAHEIRNIEAAYQFVEPSDMVTRDQKHVWMGKNSELLLQSPTLLYQALFDIVANAHDNAAIDRSIDIQSAKSVSEYLLRYTRSDFSDMMQQIHYPDYDTYTVGHSVRAATLAVFVGTTLDLDDATLLNVGTAALLHDVGKSKIPGEILFKPDKLTTEEFAVMRNHASLGVEILLAHSKTSALDIASAWGHHIRYDGKGYPETPAWSVRHPITALLQICDVFEALTAIRPYKPPLSPQEAYSIMISDEGAFHPALLAHFISVVGLYPPGNIVTLSDGRKGTVISTGKQIERPEIEIMMEYSGDNPGESSRYLLNLDSPENRELYITGLDLEQ